MTLHNRPAATGPKLFKSLRETLGVRGRHSANPFASSPPRRLSPSWKQLPEGSLSLSNTILHIQLLHPQLNRLRSLAYRRSVH